jgi:hypothetical protein
MKTRDLFPLAAILVAAPAAAQERQTIEEVREIRQLGGGPEGDHTFQFAWSAESFEGKQPLKNAPYSATAITEVEQTLGDGNRIHQKTKSQLARDREGRSRRELNLAAVGPLAVGGTAPKMIFLQDPVAGTSYHLDAESKVARKLPRPTELSLPAVVGKLKRREPVERSEDVFTVAVPPPGPDGLPPGGNVVIHDRVGPLPMLRPLGGIGLSLKKLPPAKSEDLGTQVMEGVRVQGTRTTATIPAGEIGNEKPIVTTSERWFSPDLGVVVMSKHSDPRLGTTTYKLTDLVRNDPDPALFQVPADYTVKEEPGQSIIMRRKVTPPAKP